MSVNRITRNEQFGVNFVKSHADVYEIETGRVIFSAFDKNGLKYVQFSRVTDNVNVNAMVINTEINDRNTELCELWHKRTGHISAKYLRELMNNANNIPKLKISDKMFRECIVCAEAKSTRLPHNKIRKKPTRRFEILCSDILDMNELSYDGKKYVITFTDAFSGYIRIVPIEKKSEITLQFSRYHKRLENQFKNEPVTILRTDNAKEYIAGDMELYCDQTGITIDSGAPYSPELNGLSERKNRVIIEKTRSLLIESGLASNKWSLAIRVVEYLMNRTPTKTNLEMKTPYEIIYGTKPDRSNLRVFGCVGMVHIPKETRTKLKSVAGNKLVPTSSEKILVGYTSTGYEFLDPKTEKVIVSRDVIFIENKRYENTKISTTITPDVDEDITEEEVRALGDHTYALYAFSTARKSFQKNLRKLSDNIPKTYQQAMKSEFKEDWIGAINREFNSHEENETWEVIPRRSNVNLLQTKWVFSIKYDEQGNEIAKARLVAIGCNDVNEYVMQDTYSPVCPIDIIRFILSITVERGYQIVAMDITTAFLYGSIDKEIHIRIPAGIELDSNKYMMRLKKSLYGLKISSKKWYETLKNVIERANYVMSNAERCLFYRKEGADIAILVTYVDDLLLVSNSEKLIEETQINLKSHFKIKIQHNPTTFVGLELYYDREEKTLQLSQINYINRMIEVFEIGDQLPQGTRMETKLDIPKSNVPNDDLEFRGYIGAFVIRSSFYETRCDGGC